MRHGAVGAVARQHVLGQVVGADAKSRPGRASRSARRGHFDHNAETRGGRSEGNWEKTLHRDDLFHGAVMGSIKRASTWLEVAAAAICRGDIGSGDVRLLDEQADAAAQGRVVLDSSASDSALACRAGVEARMSVGKPAPSRHRFICSSAEAAQRGGGTSLAAQRPTLRRRPRQPPLWGCGRWRTGMVTPSRDRGRGRGRSRSLRGRYCWRRRSKPCI